VKKILMFGGFASIAFALLALLRDVAGPAFCLLPIHSCFAIGDETAAQMSHGFVVAGVAAGVGATLLALSSRESQRQDV
jgi:hypothetical protein